MDARALDKVLSQTQGTVGRKPHWLRPTKHSPSTPARVVYIDTESIVEDLDHIPYLICADYCSYGNAEEPQRISRVYGSELAKQQSPLLPPLARCVQDLTEFTRQKEVTYLIAHNAGYDIRAIGLIPQLQRHGWQSACHPYEKGMTFIWESGKPNPSRHCQNCEDIDNPCKRCQRKDRWLYRIRLLSSSNYYPRKLETIGRIFGFEKFSGFDFSKLSEYLVSEVIEYCQRDVAIVRLAMEQLYDVCQRGEQTGFGGFKNTLPAMSFNSWKTWHVSESQIYLHARPEVVALERNAYCGGRVEVWRHGRAEEQLYKLDINSMYPTVMAGNRYPVRLRSYTDKPQMGELEYILEDPEALVVANVQVKAERWQNAYPYRSKGKLLFPTGQFQTCLSTPELRYAIQHGHIVAVDEIAVYHGAEIFRGFVQQFYQLRQAAKAEGNMVMSELYKLLLNSLYGKFGQLKRSWVDIGQAEAEDLIETETITESTEDGPVSYTLRRFGGRVYIEEPYHDIAYHAYPAIAAHVTAQARQLLWGYILAAGVGNHYYNDTDSLIVNETGRDRLAAYIDDSQLGRLKIEEVIPAGAAEFLGPKVYRIGEKWTRKGIPGGGGIVEQAAEVTADQFRFRSWGSTRSAIRDGDLSRFRHRWVTRRVSRDYTKGTVQEDGRVVPYRIDDLKEE